MSDITIMRHQRALGRFIATGSTGRTVTVLTIHVSKHHHRKQRSFAQDMGTESRHHSTQHYHHAVGYRARSLLAHEWLRTYGWRLANVNPLRRDGFMNSGSEVKSALPPLLRPLVQTVVDARVSNSTQLSLPPSLVGTDEEPLLISLLETYCNNIGYEFMHSCTFEERQFFVESIEKQSNGMSDDDAQWCYEQVLRAGSWERVLGQRYPTCRRFSLEGLESAVLALNTILDTFAAEKDATTDQPEEKRVVLGSLHRGRVNLLHTVLQRNATSLLSGWDSTDGPTYDDINVGHSTDVITRNGHSVHVSLLNMPAHLESQDASIAGKALGHMTIRAMKSNGRAFVNESIRRSILSLVVHGDASFCGQGIVAETCQLSTFTNFDCGGTIHVILNNQIGFTTETQQMRSNRLVTVSDVALGIRAPILHVNGECLQDVWRAARFATEYRQKFGRDVVLDVWGFRKYGHNELDEPRITNVNLYQEVDQHIPVADLFARSLCGPVRDECERIQEQIKFEYQELLTRERQSDSATNRSDENSMSEESHSGEWVDFMTYPVASNADTDVEFKDLKLALSTISNVPDGFTLHQATNRAVSRRIELFEKLDDPNQFDLLQVDWATAELLSLCTLANEGRFCRLSGQDSQRGTFGQRHAVWHDAVTGDTHHALPPSVQVVNSPLSELGVLGFEHGFSLASPNFLVLWEAQFADFVDNSQVLIDTMISSEKDKFALESNLVLLLPHGYDGMGPEHSSARLERFLTLHTDTPDAEERAHNDLERLQASNFLVTYPTSPSNYFHLLRRSFTWAFRRPMVVLTPKRTLRVTKATSSVSEFLKDTTTLKAFSPVLDDRRHTKNDSSNVKSIVVCSGELFYDIMKLLEAMPEDDSHNVAVFRLEQLAPFPFRELKTAFDAYPNAQRVVWVQEEPGNMGALRFVAPFLARALPESIVLSNPIARPVSAAPATGNPVDHQKSHQNILLSVKDWIQKRSD